MRKITRASYGNGKMVTTLEATWDGEEVRLRWSPSAADCAGKTRHTDSLFLLCSVLFWSAGAGGGGGGVQGGSERRRRRWTWVGGWWSIPCTSTPRKRSPKVVGYLPARPAKTLPWWRSATAANTWSSPAPLRYVCISLCLSLCLSRPELASSLCFGFFRMRQGFAFPAIPSSFFSGFFRMQQGFAFPAIASCLFSGFFHMWQQVFAFPDVASSRKLKGYCDSWALLKPGIEGF